MGSRNLDYIFVLIFLGQICTKFQIQDIQTNFVIDNNKCGWQAAIDGIEAKYSDPNPHGASTIGPPTAKAAAILGVLAAASSS